MINHNPTLQSSFFSPAFHTQSKKKKQKKDNSLLMRTLSVSAAAVPDNYYEEEDDVFEEPDSEIEYQLQVKPKSQQTELSKPGMAMQVVAIPRKETEFNMMSLIGKNMR